MFPSENTMHEITHGIFFLGPMGKREKLFKSYYDGDFIPVVFNPKRPRSFALEIPFTPCWFDTLF